jgi:hypothetical protein
MASITKSQLKRQEARFEEILGAAKRQARETELTPEKREARRARCMGETPEAERAFCTTYFPEIFESEWNDLHRWASQLEEGSYTMSGFRKAGKSAYVFVAKVVRGIVLGAESMIGVNLRTHRIAKERVGVVKRMIARNELIQYDYAPEIEQGTKSHLIVKGEQGRVHVVAGSYKIGLRSQIDETFSRFTLAVNDDLYDRDSADSERDNEKVTNFVTAEVRGAMEDDGLDITLGNSITADCPIVRLKELIPENHFSLPALGEDGETTWPERYSTDYWEAFRAETPYDIWMGEYMDEPGVKGGNFKEEWLRTVKLNLTEIVASISALDPAHGESPSSCFKGLATLGMTAEREAVLLDIYVRREGYLAVFDYLLRLRRRYGAHHRAVLVENDFNQWAHARPYYQTWTQQRGEALPIVTHLASETSTAYRSAAKESRILNLVHPHQTGGFAYSAALPGSGEDWDRYKRQYLGFGKLSGKLDGLDAVATAYIMINRYLGEGSFQAHGRTRGRRRFGNPSWGGGFH